MCDFIPRIFLRDMQFKDLACSTKFLMSKRPE